MDCYRVELTRKASSSKNIYQLVRTFSFEAASDQKAANLARSMEIFPGADDCDMAVLFAPNGTALWTDHGNA